MTEKIIIEVIPVTNEQVSPLQIKMSEIIFKKFGLSKKIKFGQWFDIAYRLLVNMRGLRGTRFDIFGYDHIRRVERALIPQYRHLIEQTLSILSPDNYSDAVKLANLPDMIRGYDEVKLKNVQRFCEEVKNLGYSVNLP